MFIVLDFEEEDEGDARTPLETQVAGGNEVLGTRFWKTPIDLDKEMEDIEKVSGMIT